MPGRKKVVNPRTGGLKKGIIDAGDSSLMRFHSWARNNGIKVNKDKGKGAATVAMIKQRAKNMGIAIPSQFATLG